MRRERGQHRLALSVALCCVAVAAPAAAARSTGPAHAAIIGGRGAEAGTFPWLAYVLDRDATSYGNCTGTVIAARLVLTAAHCVENEGVTGDPGSFRIVSGAVNRNATDRQLSAVSQVLPYPGYNSRAGTYDAALLVLATPTTAAPLPLAAATAAGELLIAGWGRPSFARRGPQRRLRTAVTREEDAATCQERMDFFDPWTEICVQRAGVGPCNGDSGGPLIAVPPSGVAVDIGIASYVFRHCSTSLPSVYTRVSTIADWIHEQEAILAADPPTPVSLPDYPGVYSTNGAGPPGATLDLARDGIQIDYLRVSVRFSCPDRSSIDLNSRVDLQQTSGWPIEGRTAEGSFRVPPSRSWRGGEYTLRLRFDELGEAEATISGRVTLRGHRGQSCSVHSQHFSVRAYG